VMSVLRPSLGLSTFTFLFIANLTGGVLEI
jgi:hypothetical protein